MITDLPSGSPPLVADKILEHVEFLSIGTNDLTKYTMVANRDVLGSGHPHRPVSAGGTGSVAQTARAGQATGKRVGGESYSPSATACNWVTM